jgi:hypothetical protein
MNRAAQEHDHLAAQKNVSGSAVHFYRKIEIASDVVVKLSSGIAQHKNTIISLRRKMLKDLLCTSTGKLKLLQTLLSGARPESRGTRT